MLHPHALRYRVRVSGVRRNAPFGPSSRRIPPHHLIGCRRDGSPVYLIMGGANLLTGDASTFEAGVGGWTSGLMALSSSTDQAQAGTHSLKCIRNSPGGGATVTSALVAVTAGVFYTGSIYCRTAVTGRTVLASLYWYDAGSTFVSLIDGGFLTDTTTGWQQIQVTGSPPAGVTQARLVISYGAGTATNEAHYLDTASIDGAATDGGNKLTFTTTTTWVCPSITTHGYDVTEIVCEVRGGGAGGGNSYGVGSTSGGSGGGGGAYSRSALTVVPGTVYTVTVGAGGGANGAGGDSWFSTTGTILAKGGGASASGTAGTGGAAGSGVGTTKFSGGNGTPNASTTGGGGGGGAGDANAGGNAPAAPTGGTGGAAGGGNGGAGGATLNNGVAGSTLGGAGGGAGSVSGTPGNGARGEVTINPTKFKVQNDLITEHVPTSSRKLTANRAFGIITEHVVAQGTKQITKSAFGVITEHVTSRQKVVVKTSRDVITEHVVAFQRRAILQRSFGIITEHVVAHSRALLLARTFPVVTEHVTSFTKIVQYVRTFPVITEHVVGARIELDFDDLPDGGGGTTIIKKMFPVFDD